MLHFNQRIGQPILLADRLTLTPVAINGDEVTFELSLPAPPATRPKPRATAEWSKVLGRDRLIETPTDFNPC